MDTLSGVSEPAAAPQTVSNDVSNNRTSTTIMRSPVSSAPNSPAPRRPSHPATSPYNPSSPRPPSSLRRTSSATGLNERPNSSPSLMKRSSRSSLGAQPEDNDKRPTPKRSISNLISGLREAHTKMEAIEEPVPLTAAGIANEHFARQLATHARPDSSAETVVILHDACYGHRYSRPKSTKTTLSMIVERPERIHASVLGASTAYVRLGGHHEGASNAPHPEKTETGSPPFKIRRTARSIDITSPWVTNVHGTSWMTELRTMANAAGGKLAAGSKELSRSSTPTEPEKRKLHEGDLYLCDGSLDAFQGALGGVADAVDTVFAEASSTKRAFVAIRPPGHHCAADFPSGFCWLNNVHVGIEYAAQTYGLTHAAMLDFDLHHGDGSQAITWQRNSKNNEKRLNAKPNSKLKLSPDIGYYSLHDINSYPCEMGDDEKVQAASLCIDNAHGQSIWNVHLQPWKTEAEFWQLYETRYRVLIDKARMFLNHHTARLKAEGKVQPRAAVFISAGFDASEWEGAGMQRHKVNVPTEFYARFTRDVVEMVQEQGTGCDGRLISVLEGGYSDRALCSGVLSHLSGLCAAPNETIKQEDFGRGDLDQMMRGLGINGTSAKSAFAYDKSWWSAANLTALELKVNPPPPAQAKKMRVGQQPTYATPTESFAYKVVDANKFARSISGTMRETQMPARPPTPPPPEVEWVIATQELSKLLIPTDRQTKSCTPEELAGPKVKKDHTSTMPTTINEEAGKPRQLRDRKTKGPIYPENSHSDDFESVRSVSRSSRRQTIADLPSASEEPAPSQQRRASRRMSDISVLTADLESSSRPGSSSIAAGRPFHGAMKPPPPPGHGVQVKKTRPSGRPKKETTDSAPTSPARAIKPPARLSGPSSNMAPPVNDGIDALTSNMKKVTLKVGSKEEHDRKQKEKVDGERRARALKAAETRKVNAAAKRAAKDGAVPSAKVVAPQPTQDVGNIVVSMPATSGVEPPLQGPNQPTAFDQPIMMETPAVESNLPPSQTYALGMATQTNEPTVEGATNHAASYDAPEMYYKAYTAPPVHSVPTYQQQYLQHPQPLDQSTSQVPDSAARQLIQEDYLANPAAQPQAGTLYSPAKSPNGVQLPNWSTTGVIPFASADGNSQVSKSPPKSPTRHAINESAAGNGYLASVGEENHPTLKSSPAAQKEASIWDVPETPHQ